jgi:hypothetical protein
MLYTFKKIAARTLLCVCAFASLADVSHAQDNKNLAPGFTARPASSKLVILPADLELFSISAGGVREPKADWTQSAVKRFRDGLNKRKELLGANVTDLAEKDVDEVSEVNALHGAVAQSVFLHHVLSVAKLPTKAGALDWSLGEAVKPLKAKTGADYALFVWIRDSYASAERKAAIVVMALLGVGIPGGSQIGYASLVDLNDGRIVWFNDLRRGSGDLREALPAQETVDLLLKGFPASK